MRPFIKTRLDFVTNSSSSSFVISKKHLTEEQLEMIRDHSIIGEQLGLECAEEPWQIEENDMFISGYTWMDNFDIGKLFEIYGIPDEIIEWRYF